MSPDDASTDGLEDAELVNADTAVSVERTDTRVHVPDDDVDVNFELVEDEAEPTDFEIVEESPDPDIVRAPDPVLVPHDPETGFRLIEDDEEPTGFRLVEEESTPDIVPAADVDIVSHGTGGNPPI